MKTQIQHLFFQHWQRKTIAIICAIFVWLLVNHSITVTRTFNGVSIKVINLPFNRTIEGLLPNGTLNQKVSLSLTGTKSAIEKLIVQDLEILIDASKVLDDAPIVISKRNLHILNPEVDLRQITDVEHNNFTLHLTNLITENIPVNINKPIGDPPQGYQFLDVWPQVLVQTVSGPEDQVKNLKKKGLDLTFNLNEITPSELDTLYNSNISQDAEISFYIPQEWKRIAIPFRNYELEDLNDPDSKQLKITFLKSEHLAIDRELPIRVFYPPIHSKTINPNTYSLEINALTNIKYGLTLLTLPVFVRGVSRSFLDIVKDSIEITINAQPITDSDFLPWSVEFINPHDLENKYVKLMMASFADKQVQDLHPKQRKQYLRNRFRHYMREFELLKMDEKKLKLEIELQQKSISIRDISSY